MQTQQIVELFEQNLVVLGFFSFLILIGLIFVILAPLKLYSMDKSLKYLLVELKTMNTLLREAVRPGDGTPAKKDSGQKRAPDAAAASQSNTVQ